MARQRSPLADRLLKATVMTVVAAFVWLFAESQTLVRTPVETSVSVAAPRGSDRIVEAVEPDWDGSTRVTLEAPRGAVDSAMAGLAEGVRLTLGAPGGPSLTPGEQEIPLATAIAAAMGERLRGASVVSTDPATLRVRVDVVRSLEDVPITLEATGLEVTGSPRLEPPVAQVRGPAAILDRVQDEMRLVARPDGEELAGLRKGVPERLDARVAIDGVDAADRARLTVTPRTVDIELTVRSLVGETTVPAAPLQLLGLPTDLARWRVSFDRAFVDTVRVRGPAEVIEQITAREAAVVAVVWLTTDELESGLEEKAPSFVLVRDGRTVPVPGSVEIAYEGGPIGLTIERRETADAAPE